jgi:thiol:disulfide interchange protein DsbD
MLKIVHRYLFLGIFCIISIQTFAQIEHPVSWKIALHKIDKNSFDVSYSATIETHWHLYSYDIGSGGPVPTTITFKPNEGIMVIGNPTTNKKPTEKMDPMFDMKIRYFDQNVTFTQKIKIAANVTNIAGYVEFMTCNDEKCLQPEQEQFNFDILDNTKENKSATIVLPKKEITTNISKDSIPKNEQGIVKLDSINKSEIIEPLKNFPKQSKSSSGLWMIFIGGFLGGLLALLTPCVFPMIPLTVSFFIKRKKKHLTNAFLYGLSIIVIYVGLGFITTVIFGPDAMNALSTNPLFNVILFALLVVFGASFLGAFELQLPTGWSNFFERKADTTSGLVSIFFMAFTLGLVSFSCTGPIIGTLLVEAASSGSKIGPLVGMFGFSLALAMPFTFFALFPSLLGKLPRSGGWLNSVKVVLGFLEIAFALKFLSTADLAAHWGILPRETFLCLWIVIFTLLGFYLLGTIRFAHDSQSQHVTVTRFFMALISFSFALYMVPGLWGAPLKAISAFSPPQQTQDFDLYTNSISLNTINGKSTKRYGDLFHSPYNLNSFFDYDEGMAYARKVKKPVIIDFTGHGCVNCRKMEVSVWSDKHVLNLLSNEYVLISLYVDDRTELPLTEQKEVTLGNKSLTIKTLGNKWSYFQASNYGTNSQPYYVLLDNEGKMLSQPGAYDLSVEHYISFLEKGIIEYKKREK